MLKLPYCEHIGPSMNSLKCMGTFSYHYYFLFSYILMVSIDLQFVCPSGLLLKFSNGNASILSFVNVLTHLLFLEGQGGNLWQYLLITTMAVQFSAFFQLQIELSQIYWISTSTHPMMYRLESCVRHTGNWTNLSSV